MARKRTGDNQVQVGNVTRVSGTVTIAGGDIYEGYTAEQVSLLLTQITSDYQRKPFDGRCPYKGLEVFEEEDADLFFGRERLVEDLVHRVRESRTVFITGPSGSGKSSLVRAGLIHALKQRAIKGSERWLYETMKPGREPLQELALAFSRLKSPELANYFHTRENEANVLNECAESVLSGRKDQRFVLFVDQFEEVFTQINSEEERVKFINMLAHAATVENGRVIVLFAMRSDFVSNCATYPQLNELLSQEFRQIGAMQPEELVSAIALPARHVGLPIEDELIARIINDMKGEPGALPLMQFALKDLFDSQQEKGGVIALTLEDYLRHGGIHKSLERHADRSFAKLSQGEQDLARSIFSGLIEIGRGTVDTRRTALFDELIPAHAKQEEVLAVVQNLADARLVITDEQAGKDTVTISHEKLIDAWPWLKKLVNENRDVIALQNEIATDAKEWDDHGRDSSYLYTGARLTSAREKLEANQLVLSGLAQLFIETGVKTYADELDVARKRAVQLRRRSIFLTSALVAALISVGIAVFFSVQSQKQAKLALARQLAAQAQSLLATQNSKQMIAILLAIQSMEISPSAEAAQIFQSNLLADRIASVKHDGPVFTVAFRSDGKYVVSTSRDRTARVWETNTGKEVSRMTHAGAVFSAAFSPDGNYVISTGCDNSAQEYSFACLQGSARVWEAMTGKEIVRITYDGLVFDGMFSPDGKYAVSVGCDAPGRENDYGCPESSIRIWNATTGEEITRKPQDPLFSDFALSPDGRYVISASGYKLSVWETMTGHEVTSVTPVNGFLSVIFSPDNRHVASVDFDNTVQVWDVFTGEEVSHVSHNDSVSSIAFSPNGQYVISGSEGGTTRVWEATTGTEIAQLPHDDGVISVAFSPDGNYVISGSQDMTARVWEVITGTEIARMTHDDAVYSVAFSPDGKYIVSGSEDGTARVWEASHNNGIITMLHDDVVSSASFSADGKFLVSGSWDSTARVWEVSSGREILRLNHEDLAQVYAVAFSPDGEYIVSGAWESARVWEVSSGTEILRLDLGYGPADEYVPSVTSLAISPDGKYVISGSDDKTARVWDATTGVEIARMTHNDAVSSVAFSPDGRYAISGSWDGTARIWDATTGKEFARMTHDDAVSSVAFSADGRYAISGSYDLISRIFEVRTGEEVSRIVHEEAVSSNAFSPDGKYVVSGTMDNKACVWEVATGRQVACRAHEGDVYSVSFSPDGKYVVSAGRDRTVQAWIWRPKDLIAHACSRIQRNLTHAEWTQYVGDALPYQAGCPNLPIEPEVVPTGTSTPMP